MSFLAALALTAAASLQELEHASPDLRYEMGIRVQAMERAFERATPEQRAKALPIINDSVSAFFSLDLPAAMRALDQARAALTGREAHWSDAFAVTYGSWLYEAGDPMHITVSPLYSVELPDPVVLTFPRDGKRVEVETFPFTYDYGVVPERKEDQSLWDLGKERSFPVRLQGQNEFFFWKQPEFIENARNRAKLIQARRSDRKGNLPNWVAATTRLHLEVLSAMLSGPSSEMHYPGDALLRTCEGLMAAEASQLTGTGALRQWCMPSHEPFEGLDVPYPSKQWIAFDHGDTREVGRVFLPEGLETERPPLIIALHGMGGSENMFFESYGAGKIAKLANEASWMVAAPRVSASHDVVAFTKRMIELLDADPERVFFIGHSMGAGRLIAEAAEIQEAFQPAGVILLGGGRPVRNQADLKALTELPVYLGWGEFDFALPGATALRDQLQEAGAQQLTAKVIENSEHLTVVQVALDDCFAWMQQQLEDDAE